MQTQPGSAVRVIAPGNVPLLSFVPSLRFQSFWGGLVARIETRSTLCEPHSANLFLTRPDGAIEPRLIGEGFLGRIIADDVCRRHRISRAELFIKGRKHHLVAARWEICYLVRAHTDLSKSAVGRLINRDRTTVIHACARYAGLKKLPTAEARRAERIAYVVRP